MINDSMKSNKLIGYDDLFIKFEKLYLNKRLPKVILLSGDKGIGKSTFIFHFINYILSMNSKIPYDKDSYSINLNNETYKKIINNNNICILDCLT